MDDELTLEQIEKAYKIAARIVAMYGDDYLPVFERMHREVKEYEQKAEMKSLALTEAHVIYKQVNEE